MARSEVRIIIVECPGCHHQHRRSPDDVRMTCDNCGRIITIHASGMVSDAKDVPDVW